MSNKNKYEAIIGLEVHAQLITQTKAYSSDRNLYGEAPNSLTSIISLAHPGTLPKVNDEVINHAIKLGLAVGAKIIINMQEKIIFMQTYLKDIKLLKTKHQFVPEEKLKSKLIKLKKTLTSQEFIWRKMQAKVFMI